MLSITPFTEFLKSSFFAYSTAKMPTSAPIATTTSVIGFAAKTALKAACAFAAAACANVIREIFPVSNPARTSDAFNVPLSAPCAISVSESPMLNKETATLASSKAVAIFWIFVPICQPFTAAPTVTSAGAISSITGTTSSAAVLTLSKMSSKNEKSEFSIALVSPEIIASPKKENTSATMGCNSLATLLNPPKSACKPSSIVGSSSIITPLT